MAAYGRRLSKGIVKLCRYIEWEKLIRSEELSCSGWGVDRIKALGIRWGNGREGKCKGIIKWRIRGAASSSNDVECSKFTDYFTTYSTASLPSYKWSCSHLSLKNLAQTEQKRRQRKPEPKQHINKI